MSDSSNDAIRLQATEAQMRRALGLDRQAAPAPGHQPPTTMSAGSHRGPRRFVRDGEVPVTVVHHDDGGPSANKLDAARQGLREQIAARERAERLLEEARAAIQTLETKIAHERIAKEEAIRRVEDERHAIERQLEEERATRQRAERERDEANAGHQEVGERLRAMMAAQEAQKASQKAKTGRIDTRAEASGKKPRGRPPKVRQPESEFVEWWRPGWKDKLR